MNPQPGEVWLADLGLAAKTRPVVIVSRFDPDPPRPNHLCTADNSEPTESIRSCASKALLPRSRLGSECARVQLPSQSTVGTQAGKLPEEVMGKIKHALMFALELETKI